MGGSVCEARVAGGPSSLDPVPEIPPGWGGAGASLQACSIPKGGSPRAEPQTMSQGTTRRGLERPCPKAPWEGTYRHPSGGTLEVASEGKGRDVEANTAHPQDWKACPSPRTGW